MDTARQILRFSIPGSIFLLYGAVSYLIFRRIQGVLFAESATVIEENVGVLVAVLATVPIGFVIYQAYYFTYEPVLRFWPLRWKGRLVRADRGAQVLRTLDPAHIRILEEGFGCKIDPREPHVEVESVSRWLRHPWKSFASRTGMLKVSDEFKQIPSLEERKLAYEEVWYRNWDVLRSTIDIAGSSFDNEEIKAEYTNLSDIYHSLGAARVAVLGAAAAAVALVVLGDPGQLCDAPLGSVGGLGAIVAMTTALWLIFHSARGRTWRSAQGSLQYGLRWLLESKRNEEK